MADAESELRRTIDLLSKFNNELSTMGEATKASRDKIVDSQVASATGLKNFTKSANAAGQALGVMVGAVVGTHQALMDGKRGAAAFNDSLDKMTQAATLAGAALSLLIPGGPLVKGLIAGLTALTAVTIGLTQRANKMADQMFKGYQDLSKVGGAAAGGMDLVQRNAHKLGLTMNELSDMVELVATNSKDLAAFSGSVYKGVDYLADMGKALEGNRQQFFNLGLTTADINNAMAGYMRSQVRMGMISKASAEEQSRAAQRYILEMDTLAKLTGMSNKEMEQKMAEALTEEMFLAKAREIEYTQGKAARKKFEDSNLMVLHMFGEQAAKAYRASVTNNLADENARRGMFALQGGFQQAQEALLSPGGTLGQFANILTKAAKDVSHPLHGMASQLATMGINDKLGLPLKELAKASGMAEKDIEKVIEQLQEQQRKQLEGANKNTADAAKIRDEQQKVAIEQEKILSDLIPSAQKATLGMTNMAKETTGVFAKLVDAVELLLKVFGPGGGADLSKEEQQKSQQNLQQLDFPAKMLSLYSRYNEQIVRLLPYIGDDIGNRIARGRSGLESKYLEGGKAFESTIKAKAATGGVLTGPQSGYLAMLHGTEAVIPLKGTGMAANMFSGERDEAAAQKIGSYITDISKDLEVQVKVVDKDTKAIKDFSDYQKRYHDKLKDAMENVMEAIDQTGGDRAKQLPGAPTQTTGGGATGTGFLGSLMGRLPGLSRGGATEPSGEPATPAGSVNQLLSLIGQKESGNDYNILVGGKRADLVNMTVREVLDFQRSMPARGHESTAVGKYQIIEGTLRGIMGRAGVGLDDKFDQTTQEKLGMALLQRRGLNQYLSKKIDAEAFADNLSMEWAALPFRTGKSYYDKVGSNRSLISRQQVIASLPAGQTGGVFSGPTSGYPVMLHGNEVVIPMPNSSNLASMIGSITKTSLSDAFGKSSLETQTSMNQLITMHSDLMGMLARKLDSLEKRMSDGNDIQQKILYSAS